MADAQFKPEDKVRWTQKKFGAEGGSNTLTGTIVPKPESRNDRAGASFVLVDEGAPEMGGQILQKNDSDLTLVPAETDQSDKKE